MVERTALDPAAQRRFLPFVVFVLLLALRGWLEGTAPAGFDLRWLYALQVGLPALLMAIWWRDYAELRSLPRWRDALLAIAVGLVVCWLWVRLDEPWMRLGAPVAGFRPIGPDGEPLWALIALRWLGTALVVPLLEELFWRSFLMRWITGHDFLAVDPQRVGVQAVALSTFVFTLAHTEWLAAACAGLAYAWLYRRTGSLWTAVIAHAVTNGVLGLWIVVYGHWMLW